VTGKPKVSDASMHWDVKHMKTRNKIPTLCTTRLVKKFSVKWRRLGRCRKTQLWRSTRLKTRKLKNVWKRWYFANLVRKSFIRGIGDGTVYVIKERIDVSIPNVKKKGVDWDWKLEVKDVNTIKSLQNVGFVGVVRFVSIIEFAQNVKNVMVEAYVNTINNVVSVKSVEEIKYVNTVNSGQVVKSVGV
jgi:hypothetical protein